MHLYKFGSREAFKEFSRRHPQAICAYVNLGRLVVPGAELLGELVNMARFPFLPNEFGMRIANMDRRIFNLSENFRFLAYCAAENCVHKGASRACDIYRFVNRSVIRNSYLIQLEVDEA